MRTKRAVLAQDTFRLYRPIGRTPVSETERSAGELALRSTQKEAARANAREQLALRSTQKEAARANAREQLALRNTQKEAARANAREQLALRKESGTKCTQKL